MALQWIQAHCKQMCIKHVGTRVQLDNVCVAMLMLFGCTAWGHCFGVQLCLSGPSGITQAHGGYHSRDHCGLHNGFHNGFQRVSHRVSTGSQWVSQWVTHRVSLQVQRSMGFTPGLHLGITVGYWYSTHIFMGPVVHRLCWAIGRAGIGHVILLLSATVNCLPFLVPFVFEYVVCAHVCPLAIVALPNSLLPW